MREIGRHVPCVPTAVSDGGARPVAGRHVSHVPRSATLDTRYTINASFQQVELS